MAGFKALSTGSKALVLLGGAAIAALASYGGYKFRQGGSVVVTAAKAPEGVATPDLAAADTAVAIPEVPAATIAGPVAATAEVEETAVLLPLATPSFDVVRVEPDGTTVIAGRAEPGAKIALRVDGTEISATTADANGDFAAFFVLETSAAPRMLTMISIMPDGTELAAAAEVALAPTTAAPEAPVVVASAEPAADTAPETDTAPAEDVAAEPTAPAALLVTKDGVKVLQSGDPSAPVAELAIDTISYTPAGDVQLAGRGVAGAALRLYLDNAPLVDTSVGEDGSWGLTLPSVAPGLYTLRADQLAADGSVTARFETPFKRETQAALAAATQPNAPPVPMPEPEPVIAATAAVEPAQPVPAAVAEAVPAEPGPAAEPVVVAAAAPAAVAPAPVSITVQPGFTLWGIASKQFGDGVMYVQVFEANKDKIRDPNLIYPGQVFVIPTASE